jgi:hypothetical protein
MPNTPPMQHEELSACLASIGWSAGYLAERLDADPYTVCCWASGGTPVPLAVGAWLRVLARTHRMHPLPATWSRPASVADDV